MSRPNPDHPFWNLEFEVFVPGQPQTIAGRFFTACSHAAWDPFETGLWRWILTGFATYSLVDLWEEGGERLVSAALDTMIRDLADGALPEHQIDFLAALLGDFEG